MVWIPPLLVVGRTRQMTIVLVRTIRGFSVCTPNDPICQTQSWEWMSKSLLAAEWITDYDFNMVK